MSRIVDPFDLILVWPMRLHVPDGSSARDSIRARVTSADCKWEAVADRIRRGGPPNDDGFAFAEFAYFHPYVQRLLYRDPEPSQTSPFDLYRLKPGNASLIHFDDGDWRATFAIHQVLLYAMEDGTAILTMEISAQCPMTWDLAKNVVSYSRIIFFSHYKRAPGTDQIVWAWEGGGAPERAWIEPLQQGPEKPHNRATELSDALTNSRPRILLHWQALMGTILPAGVDVGLLGDHRMAVMAFLGTPESHSLSNDEWFALAEADGAGFKPYATSFRDAALSRAAYDRWWDPKRQWIHDQRWVVTAMVFATVKSHPSAEPAHVIERLRGTWRRQQYQIFFLAHFQRASLLVFQDLISKAASELGREMSDSSLMSAEALQRKMVEFSSRFWFNEVSAQAQGRDLYELLKRQLDLERLYREVMDDKSALAALVTAAVERRRDDNIRLLTKIGAVLLPLSLLLTFLQLPRLTPPLEHMLEHVPVARRILLAGYPNLTKLLIELAVAIIPATVAAWAVRKIWRLAQRK